MSRASADKATRIQQAQPSTSAPAEKPPTASKEAQSATMFDLIRDVLTGSPQFMFIVRLMVMCAAATLIVIFATGFFQGRSISLVPPGIGPLPTPQPVAQTATAVAQPTANATSTPPAQSTATLTATMPAHLPTPLPAAPEIVNRYEFIDFEKTPENWRLQVCSLDVCPPCTPTTCLWSIETDSLQLAANGFTGSHSLGIPVRLRPNRSQLYSLQKCWPNPMPTDMATAKIYIPEDIHKFAGPITIDNTPLVLPSEPSNDKKWLHGDTVRTARAGWQHVGIDLRRVPDGNGVLLPNPTVGCFHIDFRVPPSPSQKVEELLLLVDTIEFIK